MEANSIKSIIGFFALMLLISCKEKARQESPLLRHNSFKVWSILDGEGGHSRQYYYYFDKKGKAYIGFLDRSTGQFSFQRRDTPVTSEGDNWEILKNDTIQIFDLKCKVIYESKDTLILERYFPYHPKSTQLLIDAGIPAYDGQ